jgi:hypothetical protein
MANFPDGVSLPEPKSITLLNAGDLLADARHFVLCAEMAVANFGTDDRVSAVQSATMAALEKIQRVEEFLDNLRQVQS